MSRDTIFRIYSMTKPVVAAGLMSLFDDGKVALTDTVAHYVPAFGRASVLSPNGALVDVVPSDRGRRPVDPYEWADERAAGHARCCAVSGRPTAQ